MPIIQDRRCTPCDYQFEIFTHLGETVLFDDPDIEYDGICPKCGGEVDKIIAGFPGIDNENLDEAHRYPRFSHALGCRVDSKSHEHAIMKQRGLVRAPGAFDEVLDDFSREQSRVEKAEAKAKAEIDKFEQDKEYRRAKDKGVIDEVVRQWTSGVEPEDIQL